MGDDPKTDVFATTEPGTRGSQSDLHVGLDLPAAGYDIGDVIGKGGMGEVLAAMDLRIGREVALKRVKVEPSPEALSRFLREARIQARLEHPAILPVYEMNIDGEGRPFFTMKRLRGRTLAHRLADGGALNRVLRVFADVCLAIEYAHHHGVIHRDLKPSNIMLGDFGEVYVLDWGVARVVADREDAAAAFAHEDIATLDDTKTGALLGTPGYMAPEQLRGLVPTPAVDIYALGAILFEILTGEPLHKRGDAAVASTLARPQDSPAERRKDHNIPPELDRLCLAALSEDAAARPTAHELAEAVQDYIDGDRDVERRRQIAAQQLSFARDALAGDAADARATAMRRAGRALALDPESHDAAELVSSLLLEVPQPLPPALSAGLEDHERSLARHRSLRAVWAYLSIFAVAPLLFLLDVKNWTLVGAFLGTVGIAILLSLDAARGTRPSVPAILVVNLALAVLFTRVVGPFILTPLAICAMLVGITSIRRVNDKRWLVVVWTVIAVLLPIVLERFHVIPRSWAIVDGATIAISNMFDSGNTAAESVALVIANLVFTIVVGLVALAFARRRQDAARDLFVREWHLRHLIPQDSGPKRPWATRTR